ncbi:MAG: hypothetical protein MZW92_14865 [Comamonadaceae bacterium]|nr:hypothetical protein [Comamonadaceae bacterium]
MVGRMSAGAGERRARSGAWSPSPRRNLGTERALQALDVTHAGGPLNIVKDIFGGQRLPRRQAVRGRCCSTWRRRQPGSTPALAQRPGRIRTSSTFRSCAARPTASATASCPATART